MSFPCTVQKAHFSASVLDLTSVEGTRCRPFRNMLLAVSVSLDV
ncbi:hypothetical protein ATPR_1228 [Acetobacter tropicalis NBRC 101654]|uniref:Uncharacterized protein n=1 Tax=Acetobacter tropicalis NBRC 101654 TaxID=749388 RepID=F7VCX9_9PROT|nr:hypothetical protein ATPR_1228 [Acetobacter tropicalis NBRC 101654]